MALLLIRHGETEFNAGRVVQFPDTVLGKQGLDQAERLGRSLTSRRIAQIVTSDYARARMTAARIHHHTGARLIESAALRERNFGDIRGRPYAEFGTLDILAADYDPPGGETWPVFHARVDRAWAELRAHASDLDGDLVVVTHGLVLRSLLTRLVDCNGHVIAPDLTVANTSVTEVDPNPPWRLIELANTAHLDELPSAGAPV
ncbi:MAG: histidine phosphatase family protein [Gammaproteobacteria bacterium]